MIVTKELAGGGETGALARLGGGRPKNFGSGFWVGHGFSRAAKAKPNSTKVVYVCLGEADR